MTVDRELNRKIMILAISMEAGDDGWGAAEDAVKVRVSELGGDPAQVGADEALELSRLGWISRRDMGFGDWLGSITPAGRDAAARFKATRSNVSQRRIRLRDDLLYWLYNRIHVQDDLMPDPDGVLESGANYFGVVYNDHDLKKASMWLKDSGFITGTVLASGQLTLVNILPKGVRVVERGGSVMEDESNGGLTFNTTVHGSANVANQSSYVNQEIDQSLTWITEANDKLDALEQALPSLGLGDSEAVMGAVMEARAAVAAADAPRAKAELRNLLPFVSATTAGALGNLVANGITRLIEMIP